MTADVSPSIILFLKNFLDENKVSQALRGKLNGFAAPEI